MGEDKKCQLSWQEQLIEVDISEAEGVFKSAQMRLQVAAELDELILKLRDTMKMTIVVVTHELDSAFKIADRITVLDHGKILLTGRVEDVRASDNERIQDLLNRRPREEEIDADDYLRRLTGG